MEGRSPDLPEPHRSALRCRPKHHQEPRSAPYPSEVARKGLTRRSRGEAFTRAPFAAPTSVLRRASRWSARVAVVASTAALAGPGLAAVASGPSVTDAPTSVGTAAAGKQLTALSGNWAGSGPISYRYQWYRCNAAGAGCSTIRGATSASYPLGPKDVGKTIGLTVWATDSAGTSSAVASLVGPIAPTRPLLETTAQPVVTGAPVEGKMLQVTTGAWSPMPAGLTYQWERCNAKGRICAAIAGATQSSYATVAADLGHALLVVVQGKNGATIQKAFSTASPAIVDGSVIGPRLMIGPSVTGTRVIGEKLAVVTGVWKGVGPIGFSYQWFRCDSTGGHCLSIHGSTSPTYKLVEKDLGQTIGLTEYATDSTGTTIAYASLVGPITAAGAGPTPTTTPTISGTARVGGTLTIDPGLWTPSPSGYTYAWLLCNLNGRLCVPVSGATSASFKPAAGDAGHTIVGQVTATAAGSPQAALTPATAVVTAAT